MFAAVINIRRQLIDLNYTLPFGSVSRGEVALPRSPFIKIMNMIMFFS